MTRLASQRGISLLEVMLAMVLFAIIAGGLAGATVSSVKSNGTSRQVAVATALINDRFEQLRALDPTTNPAALRAGTHADPANPMTALGQPGGMFTRTWTVTRNRPRPGLAEVAVQVSWGPAAVQSTRAVGFVCISATCS